MSQRRYGSPRTGDDPRRQIRTGRHPVTSMSVRSGLTRLRRDNLEFVKGVQPSDGWFRRSRDGEQTALNAWLIVQHATHEPATMTEVLARREPLNEQGEVSGRRFPCCTIG